MITNNIKTSKLKEHGLIFKPTKTGAFEGFAFFKNGFGVMITSHDNGTKYTQWNLKILQGNQYKYEIKFKNYDAIGTTEACKIIMQIKKMDALRGALASLRGAE